MGLEIPCVPAGSSSINVEIALETCDSVVVASWVPRDSSSHCGQAFHRYTQPVENQRDPYQVEKVSPWLKLIFFSCSYPEVERVNALVNELIGKEQIKFMKQRGDKIEI